MRLSMMMKPMKLCRFMRAGALGMIASGACVSGWGASFEWRGDALYEGETPVGRMVEVMPEGMTATRRVEKLNERLFKITHEVKAEKAQHAVSFKIDFVHEEKPSYLLIPSVNYNGNGWGKGLEPKNFVECGLPRSYRYDRVAIPGATYAEGAKYATAFWGEAPKDAEKWAFSCALAPSGDAVTHSLIYPDEELPTVYAAKDAYTPGYKNSLSCAEGTTVPFVSYLYVAPTEKERRATRGFYDEAWRIAEKPEMKVPEPEEVWELARAYAGDSLWAEEGTYKGFHIGMRPDPTGKQFVARPAAKYEIGWCGNNAVFIVNFLEDYLKNRRQDSLDKALICIDTWTDKPVLDNGLFITQYDSILDNWEAPLDACNLGAMAYNFLLASPLCEQAGHPKPKLKATALALCDFMLKDQQEDGAYGKAWNKDGTCVDRDGSIGAFIIPGMIEAYKVTGEKTYLESAEKAFAFYRRDLVEQGYATAGALDTFCIDCESAWPLLRAAVMLYEVTEKKGCLDDAESAAYYIASWQWHYTVPTPESDDFSKYGYNTFGASSVSTQHHHISSHTVYIIDSWIKLAAWTGNEVWRERARALWQNGCQLISDGTLVIHDLVRPKGSQNEAFYQCLWSFNIDRSKTVNDWLVAWPSAFRMEALRRIENWDDLRAKPKEGSTIKPLEESKKAL